LSKLEQKIIVLNEQDKFTARYIQDPKDDRKVGNIHIQFEPSFSEYVLQQYDPMQGASSLKTPISNAVDRIFMPLLKRQDPPKKVWIYCSRTAVQHSFTEPPKTKKEEPDIILSSRNNSTIGTTPQRFGFTVKPVDTSF